MQRRPDACGLHRCGIGTLVASRAAALDADLSSMTAENASGQMRSFTTRGVFDLGNPFFPDVGTNGRRCVSCHQPGKRGR